MNPYGGADFFEFIWIFFSRLGGLFSSSMASDEIQVAVLGCIAVACGLIGPFLVLQKMTMFANSLSHTILLGIVGAFLLLGESGSMQLSHLFVGASFAALLTAVFTEGLMKWFDLTEDASVGLCFTFLFALGILAATLFLRDVHLGLESIMGNADILQKEDLHLSLSLLAMNGISLLLFYPFLKLISFDRSFASVLGVPLSIFRFFLLFLTAATCVGAFRAVGVLQVLAFLVGPYLTARFFTSRLFPQILMACGIGVAAAFFGVATTRHLLSVCDLPLSTGGMVVAWIGLFYIGGLLIQRSVYRERFKNQDMSRRRPKFEKGVAGVEAAQLE